MSEQTTNTAAPAAEQKPTARKLVKIEVLRPIMIERKVDHRFLQGRVIEPSRDPRKPVVVEVSEEDAKLFCDTQFDGHHSFSGERIGDCAKHDYRRARRVA